MRLCNTAALLMPLLAGFLVTPSWASGTVSAQFQVTATVLDNCAVSAGNLAFGDYSASSPTPVTATSTVQVTCTTDLHYTVALDGGTGSGNVTARAMSDGLSHLLGYGLYTDASYATAWGDGTGGTTTVSGNGTGSAQSLTVYGRIPAAQFVAAGNYSDLVTVTVSY